MPDRKYAISDAFHDGTDWIPGGGMPVLAAASGGSGAVENARYR